MIWSDVFCVFSLQKGACAIALLVCRLNDNDGVWALWCGVGTTEFRCTYARGADFKHCTDCSFCQEAARRPRPTMTVARPTEGGRW